jgi:predicted amidophosphoribosyltransferase
MALQQTWLSYNNDLYPHYYLCHYLPRSAGRDTLSHSLLKFKQSRQPDLEGWIDCALEIGSDMPIPPGATLVRALHHNETAIPVSPAALDLLGQRLAARLQHHYHPRLLQKTRTTRPVKSFAKPQREEELQGIYSVNLTYAASLPQPPSHWLVIDDLLTSGTTIRAIIQAIRHPCPDTPISIFTLTRADTTTPTPSLKGQNYQLEQGQDWVLSEPATPYYSLPQLKAMIRSDTF